MKNPFTNFENEYDFRITQRSQSWDDIPKRTITNQITLKIENLSDTYHP